MDTIILGASCVLDIGLVDSSQLAHTKRRKEGQGGFVFCTLVAEYQI